MKNLSRIASSAFIVIFGYAFAKISSYIFRIIVARSDMELYGSYNLALAIINLAVLIAMLGLGTGIVRYASYYSKKRKKQDIIISSALIIILPLSILFFLIFFFLSELIAGFFNFPKLSVFLKFFAFLIPLFALSQFFSSILKANMKIKEIVFSDKIVERGIRVIAVFFFFLLGFKFFGLVASFIISSILSLFFLFYFSRKLFSFKLKGFEPEILYFSFPLFLSSFVFQALLNLDTILLGYFSDVKEVALYNIALPSAQLMAVLQASLLAIFLPVITGKFARKKSIEVEYKTITRWLFALTYFFVLAAFLFGKEILVLMFRSNASAAYFPFVFLSLFYMIYVVSTPSENVLNMMKKTKLVFFSFFLAFLANFLLDILLIPYTKSVYGSGIYGASIAKGVAFLLVAFLNIIFAYKNTKIKILDTRFLKIILSGIISLIVVYILKFFFYSNNITYMLVFIVVFACLYSALLFVLGVIGKPEREALNYIGSLLKNTKREENGRTEALD